MGLAEMPHKLTCCRLSCCGADEGEKSLGTTCSRLVSAPLTSAWARHRPCRWQVPSSAAAAATGRERCHSFSKQPGPALCSDEGRPCVELAIGRADVQPGGLQDAAARCA